MAHQRALKVAEKLNNTETKNKTGDPYKLYKDDSETFTCDVNIEGITEKEATKIVARILIEAVGYDVICKGKVENSKCTVDIPKLPFLIEESTGKIKLEIIVENTVFLPWESTYIVKNRVKTNESKFSAYKKSNIKVTVKT